jgi:hypothetical protein
LEKHGPPQTSFASKTRGPTSSDTIAGQSKTRFERSVNYLMSAIAVRDRPFSAPLSEMNERACEDDARVSSRGEQRRFDRRCIAEKARYAHSARAP